jgi:hypothetical protein
MPFGNKRNLIELALQKSNKGMELGLNSNNLNNRKQPLQKRSFCISGALNNRQTVKIRFFKVVPLAVVLVESTELVARDQIDLIPDDLLFCSYISGFVDGEGCFSVSFRKLSRTKLGIEVRPSFSVGQKKTSKNYVLLARIRDIFQGGAIRSDSNRNGFYKYETRSLDHIRKHIIPFFITYPLYTQKSEDFKHFCKICSLMAAKQHLNLKGLTQIIDIAEEMNPSGTRRLVISELRVLLKKIQ